MLGKILPDGVGCDSGVLGQDEDSKPQPRDKKEREKRTIHDLTDKTQLLVESDRKHIQIMAPQHLQQYESNETLRVRAENELVNIAFGSSMSSIFETPTSSERHTSTLVACGTFLAVAIFSEFQLWVWK